MSLGNGSHTEQNASGGGGVRAGVSSIQYDIDVGLKHSGFG